MLTLHCAYDKTFLMGENKCYTLYYSVFPAKAPCKYFPNVNDLYIHQLL